MRYFSLRDRKATAFSNLFPHHNAATAIRHVEKMLQHDEDLQAHPEDYILYDWGEALENGLFEQPSEDGAEPLISVQEIFDALNADREVGIPDHDRNFTEVA